MIMFSFADADYKESVFLPDRDIYLSLFHSHDLDKRLLCMESYSQKGRVPSPFRFQYYGLRSTLTNYKTLPYKRQSSLDQFHRSIFSSGVASLGFPWSYDIYKSLDKIRSFSSGCKKHYVIVAHRHGNVEERVLLIFDRYSDAIFILRDFSRVRLRSLLGSDFETYNSWYPYVWVEHMAHPISLLSEIGSHAGNHLLGPPWCEYFLCFLRDGFVENYYSSSVFGFVYRDKFDQIIYYNK